MVAAMGGGAMTGTQWTLTPRSMRWEQAFSADGGRTWETNYVMEHTRS